MYILNFIRGFCMALADSVPGVSGGTVAFILGFYDDFVNSLNGLISGSNSDRLKSFKFLSKIGIGWVIGFILSVLFITSIFEKNIYEINSLFLGFIIASIPLIVKSEKKTLLEKKRKIVFLAIGMFVVWSMTYFNPMTGSGSSLSIKASSLNLPFIIYIFLSGMIAISAMVLPGISGSTLLLIFGLYAPIVNAIKEVLSINLSYLPVLIIFGLGVITGILGTIKGIKYCLQNHRSKTIYLIIGLMIGSIYAVIMGPTTLKVPEDPMTLSTFKIIFFVIGGLLILGLDRIKTKME